MAKEKKAKNKSRPRADSGGLVFEAEEILHLRDLTDDGLEGMSRVKLAKRALEDGRCGMVQDFVVTA